MRTAAATVVALLGLSGSAEAQLEVGAVDFKEDYATLAEANPDAGRLNLSWRGIDNTVRRIDSPLRSCDDGGPYNWCNADEELRRYAFTGTPVHLVLIGVPPWAERPGCDTGGSFAEGKRVKSCSPAPGHLDEWSAFVAAAVRRYGPEGRYWDQLGIEEDTFDVLGWEVWNEPNLPSFWNGYRAQPDETRERFTERMVSQYVELLVHTDAAIEAAGDRAGDAPDPLTIGPSVFMRGDALWEEEFAERPQAHRLDRVSFHPYSAHVDGAVADVERMRALHPDRPAWITEHGWGAGPTSVNFNVGGPVEQAEHFGEFLERLRADHPHVTRYVYFNGIDNRTNPPPGTSKGYDQMGLYTDVGVPKPVLASFHAQAKPAWEVVAGAASAALEAAAALSEGGG
jgi:hypothetical protein